MKVLSLFDGMACGYEALLRAWIKVEKYYASEIDKYAIQIAMKNHPDIIQVGDVTKLKGEDFKDVDMIIGGSPCQGFSMAWKMLNFNDPRSKLFFEFVRLVKEIKPKYFLLENVRMKKEWIDVISKELWVEPICINSALVSAQNRIRYYRTNIPSVSQPEDKGILLKDILEENVDDKFYLTDKQISMIDNWKGFERPLERIKWPEDKMDTITTHVAKSSNWMKLVSVVDGEVRVRQATKQWYKVVNEWDGLSLEYPNSTTRRWRVIGGKSPTIMASNTSYTLNKWAIRKLTPIECERLQTMPDNYTEWVSDTQRYKMLGNWWTCDVIAHIFSFVKTDNG